MRWEDRGEPVPCAVEDCDAIAHYASEPEGQWKFCDREDFDHRRARFAEMFRTGDYSEAADILHTSTTDQGQTLPEVAREMRTHLERRKAESGFDPTHDTYRRPPKDYL